MHEALRRTQTTNSIAAADRQAREPAGLQVAVARSLAEIEGAWALVYRRFLESGLIDPNPYGIYALPNAVRPDTVVVLATIRGMVVSTLTTMHDRPGESYPLPLDMLFHDQLQQFRDDGRRLLEAGMLADRRERVTRSLPTLFDLMRFVFYRTLHTATDDIIAGVHPRHVDFYRRLFAFEAIGESHRFVNGEPRPVTLLHLPLRERLDDAAVAPGLALFLETPIPPEAFDAACPIGMESITTGRLKRALVETPQTFAVLG